jgi:ABC-type sugar transport system substrate-binding protein
MIRKGQLLGAGMQQPFLMGEEAVSAMDAHMKGRKVKQTVLLPVLPVSGKNIKSMLPLIQRNVLGLNVK